MPQCSHCGREVSALAPDGTCNDCRQREFAASAEETATKARQDEFVITNLLLAVNISVFVLMLLNHVPLMTATSDQVMRWGANFGPLTLGTQPWRLLTNLFVHIGIFHILGNMWALFVLGRLAESLYGRLGFLLIYLFTGVAGAYSTLIWNPMAVSAGASGALFGISGALIATLYAGRLPLPKHVVRPVLASLLVWAALDLVYGFLKPGIDNAAHVGGLLAGVIVGYSVGHHLGPESVDRHLRWRVYAVMLAVLGCLGLYARSHSAYVVGAEQARQLLVANKPDDAIRVLKPVIEHNQKEGYLHVLMADAYNRKADFASAEKEFKAAAATSPKTAAVWADLAESQARQQKWAEAAASYTRSAELSKNASTWYNVGLMYSRQEKHAEAQQAFQKAVAINPYFADAWYTLGIAQLNLKQATQAVQSLQKAVQLSPNNAEMHLWLGNALLANGQEPQSQAEFLKAFQIRAAQQKAIQQQMLRQQQAQQNRMNAAPK